VVEGAAASARLDLSVSLAPDLPSLHADPRALQLMLINLLTNAIKFTPAGGRVRLAVQQAPDGGCLFEVSDTGIGIAEADISRVLEPFVQAGETAADRHGGAGLGLSIVKRLIELHGGRLELNSRLGAGTIVRLTFPPA
jgi:signal transduction histidine kinase